MQILSVFVQIVLVRSFVVNEGGRSSIVLRVSKAYSAESQEALKERLRQSLSDEMNKAANEVSAAIEQKIKITNADLDELNRNLNGEVNKLSSSLNEESTKIGSQIQKNSASLNGQVEKLSSSLNEESIKIASQIQTKSASFNGQVEKLSLNLNEEGLKIGTQLQKNSETLFTSISSNYDSFYSETTRISTALKVQLQNDFNQILVLVPDYRSSAKESARVFSLAYTDFVHLILSAFRGLSSVSIQSALESSLLSKLNDIDSTTLLSCSTILFFIIVSTKRNITFSSSNTIESTRSPATISSYEEPTGKRLSIKANQFLYSEADLKKQFTLYCLEHNKLYQDDIIWKEHYDRWKIRYEKIKKHNLESSTTLVLNDQADLPGEDLTIASPISKE